MAEKKQKSHDGRQLAKPQTGISWDDLPNLGLAPADPRASPIWEKMSEEEFKQLLLESWGCLTLVAMRLDCTYGRIWQALKHWELQDFLREARGSLADKAHLVIAEALDSDDQKTRLRAAETILKSQASRQAQSVTITQDGDIDIKTIFGMP